MEANVNGTTLDEQEQQVRINIMKVQVDLIKAQARKCKAEAVELEKKNQ